MDNKDYVPSTLGLAPGAEGDEVRRLQRYLTKFGYISSPALDTLAIAADTAAAPPEEAVFDSNTEEALSRFQELNSLPVTGVLDEATLALMHTPRCGVPDPTPGSPAAFVAHGTRWSTTALTYGFDGFTADLTAAQIRAAVVQAFGLWSAVTPLTFAEAPIANGPDIRIDFVAGDHGDGFPFDGASGVLAHAFYPEQGAISGDTHMDDAETWSVNTPASGIDLVSVIAHEFGHALGLDHSNVTSALMYAFYSGIHRNLEPDDIEGIQSIYGPKLLASGTYTIRQKSNGRFVDAHEVDTQDFRLVTRTAQNNDTQRWVVMPVGGGSFTIRQLSNRRFMDAHEIDTEDFRLVTRPAQNNDTQRWLLNEVSANTFTIRQKSNGRFVDAHEIATEDFRLVTRPAQNNDTQRWLLDAVGGVYTMRQKSNGRFVDAHESNTEDFRLVTRTAQSNDTQRWVVLPVGDGSFTMRQLSNGRFVDAHETSAQDFRLVTRPAQNNDTQRWLFDLV